jgi:hypothetical protein
MVALACPSSGRIAEATGLTRSWVRRQGGVMYIERLRLKNVRTFVDETLEFVQSL